MEGVVTYERYKRYEIKIYIADFCVIPLCTLVDRYQKAGGK
jgi:hypothetical protein